MEQGLFLFQPKSGRANATTVPTALVQTHKCTMYIQENFFDLDLEIGGTVCELLLHRDNKQDKTRCYRRDMRA